MREPLDWQMFCRKETKYCKGLFIGVNPHSNKRKGKKKGKKKKNSVGMQA